MEEADGPPMLFGGNGGGLLILFELRFFQSRSYECRRFCLLWSFDCRILVSEQYSAIKIKLS